MVSKRLVNIQLTITEQTAGPRGWVTRRQITGVVEGVEVITSSSSRSRYRLGKYYGYSSLQMYSVVETMKKVMPKEWLPQVWLDGTWSGSACSFLDENKLHLIPRSIGNDRVSEDGYLRKIIIEEKFDGYVGRRKIIKPKPTKKKGVKHTA